MESRIYDSRDDVKKLILSVINGEIEKVELPMKGLHGYCNLIELLGLEFEDYDVYSKGVEFVVEFKDKNGKEFTLGGSLWDKDTFTFSILA